MAAAPAESSSSHGKGLGLSHSDICSALDYSGDTFESFSEEQESEAPGSCCSTEDLEGAAVSEALESSPSLAGQSPAEEEFEAVDPAAVERAAIGKWIDAMGKRIDLKNKDTGIRPDKSAIRTPAVKRGRTGFGATKHQENVLEEQTLALDLRSATTAAEGALQQVWITPGKEGICERHGINPTPKQELRSPGQVNPPHLGEI